MGVNILRKIDSASIKTERGIGVKFEDVGKSGLIVGHLLMEGLENKKNRNSRLEKEVELLEKEVKENEAVLAAIEEALKRARAFVGSLSREDKRDSAQVRAHAKEIDQADRQLQLAKKTDANLKDAFWRLKVAADIQIIDKNISVTLSSLKHAQD